MPTTATTGVIADQAVTTSKLADQAVTAAKIADATITKAKMAAASVGAAQLEPGAVVQVVHVQSGAVATGTTVIPADDTIPQITEGDEYLTLAITPTSATSRLRIDVGAIATNSAAGATIITTALFQDATANAIACMAQAQHAASQASHVCLTHYMTAGTTSATTFRVRIGGSAAGTTTFNGSAGARLFGGALASSITITEIKA